MKCKKKISREQFDEFSRKVYHYLEGHHLSANDLDKVAAHFGLSNEEVEALELKIKKHGWRWYTDNAAFSRSITRLRYNIAAFRDVEVIFDEESPLAIF
jgi:hypothetical protein